MGFKRKPLHKGGMQGLLQFGQATQGLFQGFYI